jgi:hypothetical protein
MRSRSTASLSYAPPDVDELGIIAAILDLQEKRLLQWGNPAPIGS